jgi:competence protein ComEA
MGARVQDAIDAAGGPTRRAHLEVLNLAEIVADGAKVDVPDSGQPPAAAPGMSGTSTAPGLVNLNTADETALESIPNVGPVTAGAILKYRTQIGSFSSVDQLLQVSGIGPATLDSIRSYVTV